MKRELRELIIDRAQWGQNWLLSGFDGKLCCLGHLGRACGIPLRRLRGQRMPSNLSLADQRLYPERTRLGELFELASGINDDEYLSMEERERRLKFLFKSRGIKLTFIGKPRTFTGKPR